MGPMLRLSKLNGQELVVNLDIIKTLEATPDTVVSLMNGDRFIVREGIDEVVKRAIDYKRRILAGPMIRPADED